MHKTIYLGWLLILCSACTAKPVKDKDATPEAAASQGTASQGTTSQETTVDASASADQQPPKYTAVRTIKDGLTLATLSNGLTVIVQENHAAPVATVRCFVRNTGSAFEGRYLGAGISHVLEHVAAGGSTTKRSEKEITRIIAGFGGATNAFTSTDQTAFFIDCPAHDCLQAIELVADSMQHIRFEPSEFERELRVVRRELADGEANRQSVAWELLNKTIYLEHPVRHPIIGYLDVLRRTTNQAITNFYRERYIPNNQVFVVVGDVQTAAVLEQVAKQWAGTPRGRETYVPLPDEPMQISPREAIREMDGATCDIALAWPTVRLSDEDMAALDVAAAVLGDGESSRLARKLKYDQQLAISVAAANYTPHFVRGFFVVLAGSPPETWQRASEEILREVDRLRDEPIDEAELAKVKKQKAASLVFERQTAASSAQSLAHGFLSAGDPLFDEHYAAAIQKVTAAEVHRAAQRWLVPDRLNRVSIVPPGVAPKTAKGEAGEAETETRLMRLPNGLRVLLKRQSNLPLVNIQAAILGGALVDDEATSGRSSLVAEMLDKGTAEHSAEQIANYFDSVGGKLDFDAGRFTISGSATVLKEDFPKAAAIFADCWLRSAFPQDQFASSQKLALGEIAQRADDPQAEISEIFCDLLPASSPFHLVSGGKTASVEKLTAEDLLAYHHRYFTPEDMVVTVFGDIAPDDAAQLVEKLFGDLRPAPDRKPFDFARDNAIAESIERRVKTAKPTGMVMLGYPAPGILEKEDFAALTVLDTVMSGYSYPGGWLHEELRGEGLVYYVHAFPMAGPSPGFFIALAQTQPDKVADVAARIERNFQRARDGEIGEDEFHAAVEMICALHAQEKTTIAERAKLACLDELYGLGYDYDKGFDGRIKAVKLADLARVAKKYFGNRVLAVTAGEESADDRAAEEPATDN